MNSPKPKRHGASHMPKRFLPDVDPCLQVARLGKRDSIIVPYGPGLDEVRNFASKIDRRCRETPLGLWIGEGKLTYLQQVAERIERLCDGKWQTTGTLTAQVKFLRAYDAETFLRSMDTLESEERLCRGRPYRVWRKK